MFDSLTDKLQNLFQQLGKKGRLNEQDVIEATRQIRLALLEADVNYRVVKEFVNRIKEKAVGQDILGGLNPAQQVIKVVRDELVELLGDNGGPLKNAAKSPSVYLMVGLQGGGKTTSCGKLAALLRKQGQRPLLVATDLARPAAITQLQVVGNAVQTPVFEMGTETTPLAVAKLALDEARNKGYTHLIIDTAGRLHVNDELMEELSVLRDELQPTEILLVLDAMTGQDAVNVAEQFNERLDVSGFILTKVDGDTRGGAALSIRHVTGKSIRFLGMGEKYDALETFHADRLVSRILGMGDVLTLIERAEASFDEDQLAKMEKKLRNRSFDFDDFAVQLDQLTRMGPLDQLLEMIPGMSQMKKMGPMDIDPKRMGRLRAMISSMTREERKHPELIRGSRRRRIATGSGVSVQDVNLLMKQFEQMREMMGQFTNMEKGGKAGKFKLPFKFN